MGKTMIYFANNQDGKTVTYGLKRLIRRAVVHTLAYEQFENDCTVSVLLTDNEGIRRLNEEYRGIDSPTDVLSFPLVDFEGGEEPPADEPGVALGDIVLSLERAEEQALEFGHSFEREAAFLCVHSMLHLLGYDHVNSEEEDREMRSRQRAILKEMGLEITSEQTGETV
ncbi:MAG: rRNA maturation RNase YbeY [Clostridia bacterium]|nr:rRNA maturation RNase YbeY [Clostridia bacterium]